MIGDKIASWMNDAKVYFVCQVKIYMMITLKRRPYEKITIWFENKLFKLKWIFWSISLVIISYSILLCDSFSWLNISKRGLQRSWRFLHKKSQTKGKVTLFDAMKYKILLNSFNFFTASIDVVFPHLLSFCQNIFGL